MTTLVFSGALQTEPFLAFAEHRAARLGLGMDVVAVRVSADGPGAIAVRVAGQADLVDAFEMACSLGPLACVVQDVWRTDGDAPTRGVPE